MNFSVGNQLSEENKLYFKHGTLYDNDELTLFFISQCSTEIPNSYSTVLCNVLNSLRMEIIDCTERIITLKYTSSAED